jgi:N-acetylglucosaminyldiphosphoundecaprenol N-acetyl-beta-D-mannosaminyltransferase
MDDAINNERQDILQVKFDLIDFDMVMDAIGQWKETGQCHYITITNPHSVLMCHRDNQMAQATGQAEMVLPDGAGIILAANLLGYSHHGRVTGPNLMLHLCDKGREKGLRHFFYGGAEGVADKLAQRLTEMYSDLEVVGTHCPPFRKLTENEDKEIIDMINQARPDIVWIGLGAPKQEKWMLNHLGKINSTAMIGVGAAFDFHSGNVKWSPAFFRKLGVEWLWRLAENPKRMWRRNLDSPVFLTKVILQKIKLTFKGNCNTPTSHNVPSDKNHPPGTAKESVLKKNIQS